MRFGERAKPTVYTERVGGSSPSAPTSSGTAENLAFLQFPRNHNHRSFFCFGPQVVRSPLLRLPLHALPNGAKSLLCRRKPRRIVLRIDRRDAVAHLVP